MREIEEKKIENRKSNANVNVKVKQAALLKGFCRHIYTHTMSGIISANSANGGPIIKKRHTTTQLLSNIFRLGIL
jgi:hypothetical protein